jgi:hypothetical protein
LDTGRRLDRLKRFLTIGLVAIAALAAPVAASANDRFTLDLQPASPGHLAIDSTGTAYVAWTHRVGGAAPDAVMFCKVPAGGSCTTPLTLPIPGAVDSTDGVAGAFPVLGSGSKVYVVAPRYVEDDVVIWTSGDGGQTFDTGVVAPKEAGYSNKSDPTDVILSSGYFLIGAFNPGLGFSGQPEGGGAGFHLEFESASGTIGTASLAVSGPKTIVEAYWTLGSPYQMYFFQYSGLGSAALESSWEGPISIGNGYETKLAGGPAGIFLVSQDYGGGSNPTVLDVRQFSGGGFGSPVTLATDSSTDLFAGGAIAEAPGGNLAVAWPGTRAADQATVMRLFSSSDGGHTFGETDVAHVGSAYAINDNAQLAIADSGAGWLTFIDEGGLRMADTAPIAPPEPPVYKGKEKIVAKSVGRFELTLRLPKACLQAGQPFYAGAGRRVRRKVARATRSKLTLKKASFSFDGRKLKTLKKKPLKLLISPGPLAAGSTHTVKVRITAIARRHGKKRKVVRTLKGTISIC